MQDLAAGVVSVLVCVGLCGLCRPVSVGLVVQASIIDLQTSPCLPYCLPVSVLPSYCWLADKALDWIWAVTFGLND